jgi:hypothetical protein
MAGFIQKETLKMKSLFSKKAFLLNFFVLRQKIIASILGNIFINGKVKARFETERER